MTMSSKGTPTGTITIDRAQLAGLLKKEDELFAKNHNASHELFKAGTKKLAGRRADELDDQVGVTISSLRLAKDRGAYFTCVDGHRRSGFLPG